MGIQREFLGQRIIASALLACGVLLGMASTSSADEYWVSDRATGRVLALDATSGAFLRVIASTGLHQPTNLTKGPDGFLYVSDIGPLALAPIVRIDPSNGNATAFPATLPPLFGAGGIISDNQSIFVSEIGQFNGDEVYEFLPAGGAPLNVIGTGSTASGRTGMAFDSAGDLYVSSFGEGAGFSGSVLKHDGGSGFTTFASGVAAGSQPLSGANGLAFDSAGDLYVAGLFSQNVIKYPVTDGVSGEGVQFGANLPYPSGLLVHSDGGRESLLITSLGNDNLLDPIYPGMIFPGAVYRYNLATGTAINFLVADFDRDLVVDADDLTVWRSSFGGGAAADADGDGDSDGADFLLWQQNLGNQGVLGDFQPTGIILHVTNPSPAAVPEPAAAAMAALAACVLAGAGRLRR
ncbi:MAG: hypothetical protein H0T51_19880 [Pirellulales bacterium]|nr:hypothetical protein [Pirellulales bacterium]